MVNRLLVPLVLLSAFGSLGCKDLNTDLGRNLYERELEDLFTEAPTGVVGTTPDTHLVTFRENSFVSEPRAEYQSNEAQGVRLFREAAYRIGEARANTIEGMLAMKEAGASEKFLREMFPSREDWTVMYLEALHTSTDAFREELRSGPARASDQRVHELELELLRAELELMMLEESHAREVELKWEWSSEWEEQGEEVWSGEWMAGECGTGDCEETDCEASDCGESEMGDCAASTADKGDCAGGDCGTGDCEDAEATCETGAECAEASDCASDATCDTACDAGGSGESTCDAEAICEGEADCEDSCEEACCEGAVSACDEACAATETAKQTSMGAITALTNVVYTDYALARFTEEESAFAPQADPIAPATFGETSTMPRAGRLWKVEYLSVERAGETVELTATCLDSVRGQAPEVLLSARFEATLDAEGYGFLKVDLPDEWNLVRLEAPGAKPLFAAFLD